MNERVGGTCTGGRTGEVTKGNTEISHIHSWAGLLPGIRGPKGPLSAVCLPIIPSRLVLLLLR
jgi:hypothetical protein